jgi:hypothetical protein
MRSVLVAALVFASAAAGAAAQPPSSDAAFACGTPDVADEQAREFLATLRHRPGVTAKSPVNIPIAFHVVHDGTSAEVTSAQIETLIHNLNWAFRETPFSFYLRLVNTVTNGAWSHGCAPGSANERKLKRRHARNPRRFLNLYSCRPGGKVVGYAYYPFADLGAATFLDGVVLHPDVLPGGSFDGAAFPHGLLVAHEVGHYLGLFHTFERSANRGHMPCREPGDFVDDTPTQAGAHFSCPASIDTCPALPGADDVHNFMNYSDDECMERFTPLQVQRMVEATNAYRPRLGRPAG